MKWLISPPIGQLWVDVQRGSTTGAGLSGKREEKVKLAAQRDQKKIGREERTMKTILPFPSTGQG